MWLSIDLLQVVSTYHHRLTPEQWENPANGWLFLKTLHSSQTFASPMLSLNKRLTMDRKRQGYCQVSNLRLRLFRSSQSSRQSEGLSRTNSSSLTWPVSQQSVGDRVGVSAYCLSIDSPVHERRASIHSFVWLRLFPSNELPGRYRPLGSASCFPLKE